MSASPTLRRMRPWLALPVGGVAIGALLGYAGPGALARTVREASPLFLLLAASAYALFFLVRGVRWNGLLRCAGARRGGVLLPAGLESVAWMVSTFVPFKAGDAVRAVWVSRRREAPLAKVAGTVAMERALDLAGLALFASLGLGVLAASDITVPARWAPVVAVAWALPLLGLGASLGIAHALRQRPRSNIVLRLAGQLLDGVLAIARDPRAAAPAVAWTFAVKGCQLLVYLALLRAFLPATPLLAAAVVPLFLLSFLVTITPAHVGTYEAAFVIVFALVGLPPAELAAAAVAVHLSAIAIVSTLGATSVAVLTGLERRARRRTGAIPTPSTSAEADREPRSAPPANAVPIPSANPPMPQAPLHARRGIDFDRRPDEVPA